MPLTLSLDGTRQRQDHSLLEANTLRRKKIRPTFVRGHMLDLLGSRSLSREDTTRLQGQLLGVRASPAPHEERDSGTVLTSVGGEAAAALTAGGSEFTK